MAITILENLPVINATNNYDPVIVSSNLVTGTNFRYVLDVSGAIGSARLKCDPTPGNKYGFFGVNKIIETLFVPQIPQITSAWQTGQWAVQANLTFREETNGTLATGVLTGKIFAAMASNDYIDYIGDWLANNYKFITTGNSGNINDIHFSNRPSSRNLLFTTPEFVHAIVDSSLVTGISIRIRYYDDTGAIARTFYINRNATTISQIINVGGQALFNLTAGETSDSQIGSINFPSQGGYYDYELVADNAGVVTGRRRSRNFTIRLKTTSTNNNINSACLATTYEQANAHYMVLLFLNQHGSWDTFEFVMKRRISIDVERNGFKRNQDVYGFNAQMENNDVRYQIKYELNTDWLSDDEFVWLQELIFSPKVYIHVPTISWQPVILQNNSYTIHTRKNDGLRQLQINAFGEKVRTI